MTAEVRASAANGIWLCQTCAKLIDSDVDHFTVDLLKGWKAAAETWAREEIGLASPNGGEHKAAAFAPEPSSSAVPNGPRTLNLAQPTSCPPGLSPVATVGRLNVKVERGLVRVFTIEKVWMQLNLRLAASGGDVCLRSMLLRCRDASWFHDPDTAYGDRGLPVEILPPFRADDLLTRTADELLAERDEANRLGRPVWGLHIPRDGFASTTLLGAFSGERLPDGYEDFSLSDWALSLTYNDERTERIPLSLEVHRSSPFEPIAWAYKWIKGRPRR